MVRTRYDSLLRWSVIALLVGATVPLCFGQRVKPALDPQELLGRYPELREVEIPEVTSVELTNGMKLYLLEDHSLPVISGSALVRTGNLFDPPEKLGLAGLTGSVLRIGGTKSKTGDELDQQLEEMAASVEAGIGESSGQVSFWTLREHFDEVLAIYADVLMNPAFREDRLAFSKQQQRSSIARRNDDPVAIAGREYRNLVYGKDTPYGGQIEYEHLDRIERADLVAFYERYFFPANIMLSVYGDFDALEMKGKIEAAFQDWTVKKGPPPPFPEVAADSEGGVFLVDKQDVNQSTVRFGHLAGRLDDEDYPALQVMSQILGGGFQGRLFREVRSNLGLAYQAGAGWRADYGHEGIFTVAVGTKSESTIQAIQAALAEVDRIRTSDVSAEELRTAKDSVLNSFVFNFDTKRKTLNRLMTYRYWGYPDDFIFRYRDKVEALTVADILQVAEERLQPEAMKIVVVGNSEDFESSLDALGKKIVEVDITIPEPGPELSAADDESIAKGREILAKAVAAAGGEEKLAALRDISKTTKMTAPMGTISQKVQVLLPDTVRQENQLPFGVLVVYVSGEAGWMKGPQGQRSLPPAQAQQAQLQLFRMREAILLSGSYPSRTVNFVGEEAVDGRPAGVLEISEGNQRSVQLWIDNESADVVKISYRGATMAGPAAEVEEVYSDYRDVDGIRTPFKIAVIQNGQPFGQVEVEEISYNAGLSPADLSKP